MGMLRLSVRLDTLEHLSIFWSKGVTYTYAGYRGFEEEVGKAFCPRVLVTVRVVLSKVGAFVIVISQPHASWVSIVFD